jgi:hypothetical protein
MRYDGNDGYMDKIQLQSLYWDTVIVNTASLKEVCEKGSGYTHFGNFKFFNKLRKESRKVRREKKKNYCCVGRWGTHMYLGGTCCI